MTGKVLELVGDIIVEDRFACELARMWITWENMRNPWKKMMEEIMRYVYATDTSMTSNASLPWKNKTTIPKLCQTADNVYSNYVLTLAPRDKYVFWLADNKDDNSVQKRNAIQYFARYWMRQPSFKRELFKTVQNYIYKGNALAMPVWVDERTQQKDKTQIGYVGPAWKSLNPLDVTINPAADSFIRSPKFIRTIMSMGELKEYLQGLSTDEKDRKSVV